MVVPQTYEPSRVNGRQPSPHGFLPDSYQDADLASVHPPAIRVQVASLSGDLSVDICSRTWDYRHITVLSEQCSLTDREGHRYRLAPFQSNDYANQHIGDSRWIQYSTYASDPASGKRLRSYGSPHTLRVVFAEKGRRYVAEQEFAATYPLITIFHFIRFSE
jgi:hypothetical protein